jgi:flagellar protein FlbD
MIKLTALDGSQMFLNPDLIEMIQETPDTHITLSNGNRYLVLEPARIVIGRIVAFRGRLLRQASSGSRRYLRHDSAQQYVPLCRL